jgi:hypothetical protein
MRRKKDEASSTMPLDTVAEYQRRRRMATRLGAPFLVLAICCAIGLVVVFNVEMGSSELRVDLSILLVIVAVVSWTAHVYIEGKYNRCPNCEHVPMNAAGDVPVDSVNCPRCGARLREYGSLFF